MYRTYIHARDVCTELAIVIEDGSNDLRKDDAEDVNVPSIVREGVVVDVTD